MSAVAEQESVVLSKPRAERVYISRRDKLRLVLLRDKNRISQETGEPVETVQGKWLQFEEGRLVVPDKGTVRGARNEHLDAQYVIDHLEGRGEPGDDDFLPPHDKLGDYQEGFWVMPKIVPALSEEEAQGVVSLAIAGDVDKLEKLLAEEQAGWGRKDMLTLVGDTLEKVREAKAAVKEPVAQVEADPKAAKVK